ncbi:MAG: hypothetical protein M0Z41_14285 [Peptococcaceae bacterium]|nr:hypothetical protein [Peptococcaceae bacterium]
MSSDLRELEGRRLQLCQKLSNLGAFRRGSIVASYRRCGKANCACADPEHPGHGPQYLLTTKVGGKTQTKVLRPGPELDKVKEEVANHQKFQELIRELVDVNEHICNIRPAQALSVDSMGDSQVDAKTTIKKEALKTGMSQKYVDRSAG